MKPTIMFSAISMHRRTMRYRMHQVMCQWFKILFFVLILILSGACSKRYDDLPSFLPFSLGEYDNESVGRFKTSYLAEQIDHYYRGVNPGPLGVTTFSNLDDLTNTSSFGRMVSEQLMSELAMRGFDVIELRHADALQFLDTSGEFALSRDIGSVRKERQLGGVIVGTYVVSPVRVYINARLLDPTTSMILSAGSVEMSKTKELAKLLRVGGIPPSLERIPVKHLATGSVPASLYAMPRVRAYDIEEEGSVMESTPTTGKGTLPAPTAVHPLIPPAEQKKG